MRIVLVYSPFCPPTVMPYSLAALKSFVVDALKNEGNNSLINLDLNAEFHRLQFSGLFDRLQLMRMSKNATVTTYGELLLEMEEASRLASRTNNHAVVIGNKPEQFTVLLEKILSCSPSFVAFSVVYSSQSLFTACLIQELTKQGIRCVVGGPAVNHRLVEIAKFCANESDLVSYIKEISKNVQVLPKPNPSSTVLSIPDFSDFSPTNYFSLEPVFPIKSSTTCFYKQCTFCTHFARVPYSEFDVHLIEKTIMKNQMKHIFFIDDMISKPHLLSLAAVLKPLGVTWWCQLRPTKDLLGIFEILHDSGCRSICWGVESGSQRILDLMKKGTDAKFVPQILAESYRARISNTAYILFGFPGETRDEFCQTIDFLKKNKPFLSIVSTSVFGLQEGSYIASHESEFGVTKILGESRSWLDPKLSYTVEEGLSNDKVKRLRGRFSKTLNSCNTLPRVFKDYKEQVLLLELLQSDK